MFYGYHFTVQRIRHRRQMMMMMMMQVKQQTHQAVTRSHPQTHQQLKHLQSQIRQIQLTVVVMRRTGRRRRRKRRNDE